MRQKPVLSSLKDSAFWTIETARALWRSKPVLHETVINGTIYFYYFIYFLPHFIYFFLWILIFTVFKVYVKFKYTENIERH